MSDPALEGFPVVVPVTVQWGDMDALGHVNNARYFTWFESARMALFAEIGLSSVGIPDVGPILAHTRCDFLRPVTWPGEILAGTRISRLGNTSFTMEYEVALAGDPATPVARGEGVIVLVNYQTGQTVRLPAALREALERYRASSSPPG